MFYPNPILQQKTFSVSVAGDTTIITGSNGKTIRVYGLFFSAINTGIVVRKFNFEDDAAIPNKWVSFKVKDAGSYFVGLDLKDEPYLKVNVNKGFVVDLESSDLKIDGIVYYRQE